MRYMGKSFRSDDLNQALLLPPSLHDWLPEKHLARFLVDVVETLDLSAIYASYEAKDGRGQAAYAPEMMVRLLLYGYCVGVYSSRKIETRTYEDLGFRYLSADEHPDHDTIADFRKRHLDALAGLFTQALLLCEKAGLVKLGHVAIDGTKIKANASKHKAMSYDRMGETEQRLKQEIDALLKQADEADAAEDAQYGKGKRGDELPLELSRRETRLAKLQNAKAELEQEARQKAEGQRTAAERQTGRAARTARADGQEDARLRSQGCGPGTGSTQSRCAAQLHRSREPDHARRRQQGQLCSGLQRANRGGCPTQIIVAADLTQQTNDRQQLIPMLEQVETNMGRKPDAVSADTGYWSEANATDPAVAEIDLHVATGRIKHGEVIETASGPAPENSTAQQAMAHKLRTEAGRSIYKMRKAIVEPVFGQIKERRGFRRFSLRGLSNVRAEWKLVCATANLLKLFRYGRIPAAA